MIKQVLVFKIDTTGMDPEAALKFASDMKKQLFDSLSAEEKESFIPFFIPSFEGDTTDIKIIGSVDIKRI